MKQLLHQQCSRKRKGLQEEAKRWEGFANGAGAEFVQWKSWRGKLCPFFLMDQPSECNFSLAVASGLLALPPQAGFSWIHFDAPLVAGYHWHHASHRRWLYTKPILLLLCKSLAEPQGVVLSCADAVVLPVSQHDLSRCILLQYRPGKCLQQRRLQSSRCPLFMMSVGWSFEE